MAKSYSNRSPIETCPLPAPSWPGVSWWQEPNFPTCGPQCSLPRRVLVESVGRHPSKTDRSEAPCIPSHSSPRSSGSRPETGPESFGGVGPGVSSARFMGFSPIPIGLARDREEKGCGKRSICVRWLSIRATEARRRRSIHGALGSAPQLASAAASAARRPKSPPGQAWSPKRSTWSRVGRSEQQPRTKE